MESKSESESEMSNSNALDDLKNNGKAQFEKEEYKPMAVNIIAALKSHGSDIVRDTLNGINKKSDFPLKLVNALADIFKDKLSNCRDDDAKAKYLYDVPLFCRPEETTTTQCSHLPRMSGGVTSIKRACFKEFIHFEIYFDRFDVDEELNSLGGGGSQTQTVIDRKIYEDKDISEALAMTLMESFKLFQKMGANEQAQTEHVMIVLQPMLKICGYDCSSNHHPDFQFTRHDENENASSKEKIIMHGEAKQVKNLPQKPMDGDLHSGLSAHLCRYGFGTQVARHTYENSTASLNSKGLLTLLNITDGKDMRKIDMNEERSRRMSTMVQQLLQFPDEDNSDQIKESAIREKMIESANKVEAKFVEKQIESRDAINLWGATMQACAVSVEARMKFTVVMSARIMWFVKLHIKKNNECTVLISDGTLICKAGFTHKLIRFIALADNSDDLDNEALKKWRENFLVENKGDSAGDGNTNETQTDPGKDPEPGNSSNNQKKTDNSNNNNNKDGPSASDCDSRDNKDTSKRQRTENSGNGQIAFMTSKIRPSNICRAVSTGTNSSSPSPIKTAESPTQIIQSADDQYFTDKIISLGPEVPEMGNASGIIKSKSIDHRSNSKRMTNEEQMMWQRAFTGLGNADQKYLDQDQNKVIIPYLCQLEGAEVGPLGDGRCGTVKKIRWNGGFAAMKEYVFQHEDDERIPSDVYEHELKVFYRLKALWGTYVPRLLFHNPWSSCPSIGMEVGQPMAYDIEKWTEEDRQQLNNTIDKIKKEGFKQNDLRGANFVRLDSGYIAMIDFEDVVEISPPERIL